MSEKPRQSPSWSTMTDSKRELTTLKPTGYLIPLGMGSSFWISHSFLLFSFSGFSSHRREKEELSVTLCWWDFDPFSCEKRVVLREIERGERQLHLWDGQLCSSASGVDRSHQFVKIKSRLFSFLILWWEGCCCLFYQDRDWRCWEIGSSKEEKEETDAATDEVKLRDEKTLKPLAPFEEGERDIKCLPIIYTWCLCVSWTFRQQKITCKNAITVVIIISSLLPSEQVSSFLFLSLSCVVSLLSFIYPPGL